MQRIQGKWKKELHYLCEAARRVEIQAWSRRGIQAGKITQKSLPGFSN